MEGVVLVWAIIAIATGWLAAAKGRSAIGWFLLGLLLSIVALIMVAGLPARTEGDGDLVIEGQEAPRPRSAKSRDMQILLWIAAALLIWFVALPFLGAMLGIVVVP